MFYKKRDLIEIDQSKALKCDNPTCDYTLDNTSAFDDTQWINKPCPKCGENLLTEEDYINYKRMMKAVKWINKWFSWITKFKNPKNDSRESIEVNVHKGCECLIINFKF